ncbi:hypothetical protein H5410_021801 [Solanum commersonii]|uniref:Uncharacterized protein n=1 Tax=Solanum commersonii TaxID=4109 RepID=A0A9J5ZFA8_SOLCO|nr:hypothetical protein H5410_021801 [Solanum commersonii]
MASASHTNDDDDNACIVGEGQDADSNEEIDIEALLRNYQQHHYAFWNRKKHIVTLPYEEGFSEDDIPTKS